MNRLRVARARGGNDFMLESCTMLGAHLVFPYKIHVVQSQIYKLCSPLMLSIFMNSFFQRKACCHLYLYRVPVPVPANQTL